MYNKHKGDMIYIALSICLIMLAYMGRFMYADEFWPTALAFSAGIIIILTLVEWLSRRLKEEDGT